MEVVSKTNENFYKILYLWDPPFIYRRRLFFGKMTLINPVSNRKRYLNLPFRKSGNSKSGIQFPGIRIFGMFFSARFYSLPNATTFISDILLKNDYIHHLQFYIKSRFFSVSRAPALVPIKESFFNGSQFEAGVGAAWTSPSDPPIFAPFWKKVGVQMIKSHPVINY